MRPHINDTTTQPENEQGANFMDLLFFAKDFFSLRTLLLLLLIKTQKKIIFLSYKVYNTMY